MLSRSDAPEVDIDYFFAQVSVEDKLVDFKPTCGNILSGVGPAAIEMGLIAPQGDVTRIRVRSVNTGAMVEAVVSTPEGRVSYEGTAKVDGVPGSSAPIYLNFMDVVGSATGGAFAHRIPARCDRRDRSDLHGCRDADCDRAGFRFRADGI